MCRLRRRRAASVLLACLCAAPSSSLVWPTALWRHRGTWRPPACSGPHLWQRPPPFAVAVAKSDAQTNAAASSPRHSSREEQVSRLAKQTVGELIRPAAPQLFLGFLWALLGTAVSLRMPLAFASLIEVILAPAMVPAAVQRAAGSLLLLYAVEPVVTYLYVSQMSRVAEKALCQLKTKAFDAVLAQDIGSFDTRGTGPVISALTSDILTVKAAVASNLSRDRGLRALLEASLGLIVLGKLCPKLAWVFGILVPVAATALAETRKALGRRAAAEGALAAAEASCASEAVRNIREVRSFGTEKRELRRFSRAADATSSAGRATGGGAGRLEAYNRAVIYTSILAVFVWGSRLVAAGQISGPLLVSFVGFCFSLNFAFQGVNYSLADAKKVKVALENIVKTTMLPPEGLETYERASPARPQGAARGLITIPEDKFQGRVEFRNVDFSYPMRSDWPVFKDLCLTLPAGKVTALVGPSGAGKSTIAALLSRFYRPIRGSITIDGIDIADLDPEWLVQQVALVGQSPALFSGTVASNIAYGANPSGNHYFDNKNNHLTLNGRNVMEADDVLNGASMDQVEAAARLANAHDFISKFPQGYNTVVGEGGAQLSGGQRQRIAIARALLKNAKILCLDESTSALDAESEAAVQQALSRLVGGRTVLVIAHRLSTVMGADQICVVKQGSIVESGTHARLLGAGGEYAKLMRTQVSSYSIIE